MKGRTRTFLLLFIAALVVAASAVWTDGALAQCPLCRTAVREGETARALNVGILVLLVPPVAIFCAIFAAAYRSGKGGGDKS